MDQETYLTDLETRLAVEEFFLLMELVLEDAKQEFDSAIREMEQRGPAQ